MAEAKTQVTDQDPAEFIGNIDHTRRREEAHALDAMFQRVTEEKPKMWGTSIVGYGSYHTTYDSGRKVHWMRTGFSPRKGKHSLYLMGGYCDEVAAKEREAYLEGLGKYSRGKSCLYINKLADIDMDVLEKMVASDWATMQRIYPED